jgi:hypothetical protein
LAPNLINLESKEAHWPNRMDRAIHWRHWISLAQKEKKKKRSISLFHRAYAYQSQMRLYWKPICIYPPLLFCFSPLTDGEQLRHCSNEKLFILLLRWCSTHTHTHAQTMKILYI